MALKDFPLSTVKAKKDLIPTVDENNRTEH